MGWRDERVTAMNQNDIMENAKRAIEKAMSGGALRLIDSGENGTCIPQKAIPRFDQFAAETSKENPEKPHVDVAREKDIKDQFWSLGNIVRVDNTIRLRKPMGLDQGGFLRLQQEYFPLRSLLKDERYCAEIWNDYNNDTALMFSITKDDAYIGYCGIKDLSRNPPEISIELIAEWTHHGIGSATIPAMLDAVKERLGIVDFRIRIDPTNLASQRLFEKLGAKPNGISKFILHKEDEIRQYEVENLHSIDDARIAVAEKFQVEPRKLLSHVLEYVLAWN